MELSGRVRWFGGVSAPPDDGNRASNQRQTVTAVKHLCQPVGAGVEVNRVCLAVAIRLVDGGDQAGDIPRRTMKFRAFSGSAAHTYGGGEAQHSNWFVRIRFLTDRTGRLWHRPAH